MQSIGGGGCSVLSILSLFLSELMAQYYSGQIPKTLMLYYTPTKHQRRGKFTTRESKVDNSTQQTSWTLVQLGLISNALLIKSAAGQ